MFLVNILEQYIEYIFIESFIINIFLLLLIKNISKTKIKKLNLLISAIVVSTYSCITNIYEEVLNIFIVKILIAFLFIYIAFVPKNIKSYLVFVMYYLLIYFVFIGNVISFTLLFNVNISSILIKWVIYTISILVTYVVSEIMWKVWKRNIKKDNFAIDIKILDMCIKAFVDSGNTIKGIDNLPVIFIKDKYKSQMNKMLINSKKDILKVDTINGSKLYEVYLIKNILLKKSSKEISLNKINVLFTDMLNTDCYDALISYDTYLYFLERGKNNE